MSTYVISDIHGRHDLFRIMMKKIRFDEGDTLFILGDVADRGPDGIRTFLAIMDRPNIVLLLGNHEILFLQVIERASSCADENELYLSEEWRLWEYNGGAPTWDEFCLLPDSVKIELIRYLQSSALVIPNLKVGSRDFYLCHSTHADRYLEKPLFWSDTDEEETAHIVWDRMYPGTRRKNGPPVNCTEKYRELYVRYPRKMKMIFGHTPTSFLSGVAPDGRSRIYHGGCGHLVDIDCGCAAYEPDLAMLGCLRLDDMREFYVPGNAVFKEEK